jgi:catechol 2,3-dioxygenase-like lactoylglutathione lyase family enzyme
MTTAYTEVLGLRLWERTERHATVRLAKGFLGLWLPGAWELPASAKSAPIRLDGGTRQHVVFDIESKHADGALANLQRHGARSYGPRAKENGEVHLDFEDPDGHMLEYGARPSFGPPP